MPRHRRERGRLRRAPRGEGGSWRSALPGRGRPGGPSGASGITEASGQGAVGGTTEVGGPNGAREPNGASRPGGTRRPGGAHGRRRRKPVRVSCRQRFRLVRSLLLTPWFAAGAGIVIAAAVAVGSPAALTYSRAGPSVPCSPGCTGPAPQRPGVATASPGVALKVSGGHRRGAASGGSASAHTAKSGGARYQLGYQVIGHRRRAFIAIITMPGDLKPGTWSLAFSLPSARVERVWGALWQPSGDRNGGTALGPTQWAGRPPRAAGARQFLVLARGTSKTPSNCTLNGVSCSFG
jgi:hypothetical protein